jgi:hypothetical protein
MTPTLSLSLQTLLASLPPADQLNFPRLLEAISAVRYTGPVVIHLLNGVPKQVDLGAPIRLSIYEGLDKG